MLMCRSSRLATTAPSIATQRTMSCSAPLAQAMPESMKTRKTIWVPASAIIADRMSASTVFSIRQPTRFGSFVNPAIANACPVVGMYA